MADELGAPDGGVEPALGVFIPRLSLSLERLGGEGASDSDQEVPALRLLFDYSGTAIRASDRRDRFFVSASNGVRMIERDRAGEAQAQCLLESFGAIEISCLEWLEPAFDSEADYFLNPDGNIHTWCSFTAYAVPQLRAFGWVVSIAGDYPFRVADAESPWYARLEPDPEEREDWFGLELGVEIDGRRVDLLPALLDLLDECPDSASIEALLRVPARFRVVPVGDGRYLPVPPDRLRSLLAIMTEMYRGDRAELALPRARAGLVTELDAAFASTGSRLTWSGNLELYEHGRSLAEPPPPAPRVATRGLTVGLRPYQAEGVAWLDHLRQHGAAGILADDMGLGKTLQTIALLMLEKESGRMDRPSLVVAPKSLVENWRREIQRFAPSIETVVVAGSKRASAIARMGSADVVIISYPLLVREIERFNEQDFHYLILDEAQAIKNPRSQANGAVKLIESRHRLCLTGTPIENHLGELWALFDFLMPGFLGDFQGFRRRYMAPESEAENSSALASLRRIVAPFVLRRMKEHVAKELPPKTEILRAVELEGDQRDLYESIRLSAHGDVRKVIQKKGFNNSAIAILDALMKLRQVCCDPRLIPTPSARAVESSAKYDLFFELVEMQLAEGRKILVFSQFTRMLALLADGLSERGIKYVELTGETADRQKAVDRFQNGEVDMFLISLKAGGTGLTLTRADTVIHYDPWWNSAAQAQATDRAHRIGQKNPVFVYKLIAAGSVEERMLRLQSKKAHLASTLLGTEGAASPLDEEVLDDLFAPLAEAGE